MSVAAVVRARAAAVLGATLVATGVATAVALWIQAGRALDQALLAAAHERAHPESSERWEVESGRSPVHTWLVNRDDPDVPPLALERALASERASCVDDGARRLCLLPAEAEIDGRERHVLVAARADRPRLVAVVGPFAIAYGVLGSVLAAVGTLALGRAVRHAFAPVDAARVDVERALARGEGSRIREDVPSEVTGLVRAVNRLLDQREAAVAAQARFSAEAAHELRTPVTALLGEIEVALRRDRSAEAYRDVLASARVSAVRLGRVVEALRALSRLDTGEAEAGRGRAAMSEVLATALAQESPAIRRAGGQVEVCHVEPADAEVNEPLLTLALANLLRNAARHAPGARVELRGERVEGGYRFLVDDAGPGITATERASCMDRFARGARARASDPEGLGLGLAFAREVARRHGGELSLHASPLGGLRAVLALSA